MSDTVQLVKQPLKLFIAYSRDDRESFSMLDKHLAPLCRQHLIQIWHDGNIEPGQEWRQAIYSSINTADIILVLLSPSFLASNECYNIELANALERHDANSVVLIPVIVRHCMWQHLPIARIQALPTDARPVSAWLDQDAAWTDVVCGISRIVRRLQKDTDADKINKEEHRFAPPEPPEVSSEVDCNGDEAITYVKTRRTMLEDANAVSRVANDIGASPKGSIEDRDDKVTSGSELLTSITRLADEAVARSGRPSFFERVAAQNAKAPVSRQPIILPENPCPCGSGALFRNCHGKPV